MPKCVYISCDYHERELEQVKKVCGFLQVSGCLILFAPQPEWSFYDAIETSIDQCDTFIAIVGLGQDGSTWLSKELHYAYALNQARTRKRPRLFGLAVEGYKIPKISEHIPLEWISESNMELLLQDAPRYGKL